MILYYLNVKFQDQSVKTIQIIFTRSKENHRNFVSSDTVFALKIVIEVLKPLKKVVFSHAQYQNTCSSRDLASVILNLDTRWTDVDIFKPRPLNIFRKCLR